jgi:hypothetical protein
MSDPHFDMLGYVEIHKNRPQMPMYEDNRVTEFEGIKNTYTAAGCLIEQTRPDKTQLKPHAKNYPANTWAHPGMFGRSNCHTFQEEGMKQCGLEK